MRNRLALASLATVLVLVASPAYAHHAEWMHDEPFVQGLSMPIHGLDHLLVAFAVGLLAARIGGAAAFFVPAAFGVFVCIGGLLNVRGIAVPLIELAIPASTLLLGAMLVACSAVSTTVALLVVAALAVIQGSALLPLPAEPVSAATTAWFTFGCVISASAVIGAGVTLGLMLRRSESSGVLRYAGVTIGVLGIVSYLVPAANDAIIRLLE